VRDILERHGGIVADLFFAAAYALMPLATAALKDSAAGSPVVLYRIGTFAIFLYPLACGAMAHRMTTEPAMKEGLVQLDAALWRWFSWPLGMVFWAALLFHGVAMSMSFTWGETTFGDDVHGLVSRGDSVLSWAGIALFLALSNLIVAKMWGFRMKGFLKEHLQPVFREGEPLSFRIFIIALWIIVGPIALFIILSLMLMVPFYLYVIIWGYAISRAKSGKEMRSPLPDTETARAAVRIILPVYSILLAYFFDAGVAHMVSIRRQGTGYMPYWTASVLAMAMYYFPFRVFFALGNRKNIVGWAVFLLGTAFVYWETWRRFAQ